MADEFELWLEGLGLGQYAQLFADNAIDRRSLPHLTEDDLKELGLPLGHRRILQAGLRENRADVNVASSASPVAVSEAERRQLTVMFCDLAGSTALSVRLDPEDMRSINMAYQQCCTQLIERHGGFVARYMGDGVLAYFGYPQAHEHDAERAVHSGLALVDAVPRLATVADEPLQVRVGIATGTVVVGDLVGTGEAQERGVVGQTPNLAARLQSIAEPNSLVIADDTRRLVGNLFELQDLGNKDLKGIDGPVRAWVALRAARVESRFDALRTNSPIALVGREEESESLLRRWSLAKSGQGQVVLLSGEAGIGKSHLTAALIAQISAEPYTRLRYFCSPQHADSVLHPVIAQMERAAGLAGDDATQAPLDKLDGLLAQSSTSIEDAALLAEMLSLENDGRYPQLVLTPPQRRQKTLDALVTQLEALSCQSPVLVTFEDAHWTDPTTMELLGRLIDRLADLPVLLIVTFRPEFKPPWVGQPHVSVLMLNRLTERDVRAMIDGVIGDRRLPENIWRDIFERADGIPLFVEEMTKAVLEAQSDGEMLRTAAAIPSAAQTVPASLQASLVARLDRLGPAKDVVQIGAAIGRDFPHALLAAVARKPEMELAPALERLVDAGLLLQQGVAPHVSYLFKHALVQDAAYGLLLREPRQALHARIAEALESQFADIAAVEPEVVAYHFSRAGLADAACVYFERAGDRAVARSASAEAVAHFDAALAQASNLPPGLDRDQRELAILLKQGPALMTLKGQRGSHIEQLYKRAYDIAQPMGDEQRLFKPLWGLWLYANLNGRTDTARDRAEELLALGEQSGNGDLILEAIHCRWSTANFRGDVTGALATAQQGIELYDPERHCHLGAEFGGHDPGVCAHGICGMAFAQSGRPHSATHSAEQGIALSRSLSQPPSVAFAMMTALHTHQLLDDRAAVMHLAAQLSQLADEFGMPPFRAIAQFISAWSVAHGDTLDAGLQAMESEFPRVLAMGSMPVLYTGLLAGVRLKAGQAAQALELLDEVLHTLNEPGVGLYVPEIHRLRGNCLLRLDQQNFDQAESEFEASIAVAKRNGASTFQLAAALDLAGAWSVVDEPRKGISALSEAVSLFTGDDVPARLAVARQFLSGLAH